MKKILFIALSFCAVLFLPSCEEDNDLVFTAVPNPDGISFSNAFSSEYLLSEETEGNVAERFVWDAADFDAPTNVSYDVQASIDATFADFDLLGTTSETNFAVSVSQLLDYASDLGLDDDPTTTDPEGNPNDAGTVYFRLRAYAGAGTGNNTEMISPIEGMNIRIVEKADPGGACDPLYGVGAGMPDAGWGWGSPVVFECMNDVFTGKVKLMNGEAFRFFTVKDDWDSGQNYPYYVGEGYTIDANFEDAMDGDNNFRFTGTSGIYTLTLDEVNKTIGLEASSPLWLVGAATPGGWGWDNPTEAPEEEVGVWRATLAFSNETFRFFTVRDDWGSGLNYPYYAGEGYTIDANFEDGMDGDNNFRFIGTPGTYTVTINTVDKTITLD